MDSFKRVVFSAKTMYGHLIPNIINLGLSIAVFCLIYTNRSALIDGKGQPRICEFSYSNIVSDLKPAVIAECLAIQTTDIFTQVFLIAGYIAFFARLQIALFSQRIDKEKSISSERALHRESFYDMQMMSASAILQIFTLFAFIINASGRGIFSRILFSSDFEERMDRLNFATTNFEATFWISITGIGMYVVFIVVTLLTTEKMGQKTIFKPPESGLDTENKKMDFSSTFAL